MKGYRFILSVEEGQSEAAVEGILYGQRLWKAHVAAHHRRQQQAIVCGLVLPGQQLVAIVQALHQHDVW